MSTYTVGYIVGSLSSTSINRILAKALIRLAPDDLSFVEIPIGNLPLYSQDYDADYPPEGRALKEAIAAADAILFVTPEYNRSIPGALKNAIDWASRPWGQNSFDHMPAAVIGASPGVIGTALGQQSLRAVLAYANARQMTAPEAYIRFKPEIYSDDGSVADDSNRAVPTQLHAGIPRPHPACAHRIAAPTLTPPAEELSVRTCLRVTVDERPRVLVLRDSHWTLWTSSRHRVQTVQY